MAPKEMRYKFRYIDAMSVSLVVLTALSFASCIESDKVTFPSNNPKIHVWIFMDVECPISQFYTSILNDYQQEFNDDSVLFYAVFPGIEPESDELDAFIHEYSFKVNIIADTDLSLTETFNAKVTPEAFITKDTAILYRGKIDNSFFALGERNCSTDQFYVRYALKMLINNSMAFVKKTKAVGCIIER